MLAPRVVALSIVFLTVAATLGGCGSADEGLAGGSGLAAAGPEGSAASVSPTPLAGAWLGLDTPSNPADARLAGCGDDLGALERQLATVAGPDCLGLETAVAVQQGTSFTLLPHRVACVDGLIRTRQGSGTLDDSTLHGRIDLVSSTEVRSTFFSGTLTDGRLDLALDRLEIEGLARGTCLIAPPLRLEVVVVP